MAWSSSLVRNPVSQSGNAGSNPVQAIAVDIFNEVDTNVTALNGEVVRRALHGRCCGFITNQDEFSWMLRNYSDYRLKIHRLKIKIYGRSREDGLFSVNWEPGDHGKLVLYEHEAINLRRRLKKIWPCIACIHLYNPTHKYLRSFPQLC